MRLFPIFVAVVALAATPAQLQAKSGGSSSSRSSGYHSVSGYTTKNGVYVPPHHATNPNATKLDNWSTKGNVNPLTGKPGTIDPYAPKR